MELLLDRQVRSINSTIGKLYVNGEFECFILEDVDRGLKSSMSLSEIEERKIFAETAIPEGRYQVVITHSNRYQKPLPLLVNVPGYTGIRIHPGNTKFNTAGCLLPGDGRSVDKVINSTVAFDRLFKKLSSALDAGEKVYITIKT
ncbi:MAG TPA: DUF5675 family protein [Ferruginibacter sp.]|nr:DUF5675 family protein [Ferruginibacter sp.]HMP22180.1 DUF5675 family protein [Ferruginibacter sp.]